MQRCEQTDVEQSTCARILGTDLIPVVRQGSKRIFCRRFYKRSFSCCSCLSLRLVPVIEPCRRSCEWYFSLWRWTQKRLASEKTTTTTRKMSQRNNLCPRTAAHHSTCTQSVSSYTTRALCRRRRLREKVTRPSLRSQQSARCQKQAAAHLVTASKYFLITLTTCAAAPPNRQKHR